MAKRNAESHAESAVLRALVMMTLAFLFTIPLFVFVILREDPQFWRNEGGYPVWLREVVLETFYPLLISQFLIMLITTIFQFCAASIDKAFRLGGFVMLALLWLFLGVIVLILIWNNVDNLLNGRDLHYHPAYP